MEAKGAVIAEVLDDLDRQFPGLKFRVIDEQDRVRPHMRLFVGQGRRARHPRPDRRGRRTLIFGALSGG